MTTPIAPAQGSHGLQGTALIVAAMGVLTLNDALMRILVSGLPLGQAVAMRGLAGCLVMLAFAPLTGGLQALRPRSLRNVSILSLLLLIMLFLFPWSLQRMPLADGIMLVSSSPIFAALLAPMIVAETIGWRRWSAIFLGLVGAALVIDPGPLITWGGLVVIAALASILAGHRLRSAVPDSPARPLSLAILVLALAVLVYAIVQVLSLYPQARSTTLNIAVPVVLCCAAMVAVRDLLTQNFIVGESALAMVFMANLFAAVGGGVTLVVWAELPDLGQLGLALSTGALVSLALALQTIAFRYTGAVAISCLKYAAILWAALFGWVLFSETLSAQGWFGAALITLSGVIIAVRGSG